MLIIGAKGFAKEVLEIIHQKGGTENLCFYDDVNENAPDFLYNRFLIIKNIKNAEDYLKKGNLEFTIGIGNPKLRYNLFQKFIAIGGKFTSTISIHAEIGSFGIEIEEGCNILGGVRVSNDVKIGKGTIIYYNSVVTHDVKIGNFCEISPNVKLLGRCTVDDFVQIGSGSVIFPDVRIGRNSVVAAGSIVRQNVPDNVMVAGIPAVIKKEFL